MERLKQRPDRQVLFHIASKVGMLVCDLEDRLSVEEFAEWYQYFMLRNEGGGDEDDLEDM